VEQTVRRRMVAHVSQMLPELDVGFALFVLG
jgi:hypothetical protein